jgi:hypothetical protein
MYIQRNKKMKAARMNMKRTVNGQEINSFGQQYAIDDVNPLGQSLGSLVYAQNVEWLRTTSGTFPLQTMRGSELLCDTDCPVLGASFFSVSGVEYPVWLDNLGNLTYRTGVVNTLIEAGLTTTKETEFVPYNDAQPVLFGCNETDGLFKVDQTFGYFNIDSNPTSCICYSGTSKRIFRSFGNVVEWSDQQTSAGTSDLETFGASSSTIPGINDGTTVTKITDDGKIVWFWMDTGIWGILNPSDDATDWYIPKANSDVGTISKKTIQYAKYQNVPGYIFLATDKTLRFFSPQLESNTGTVPIVKDLGSITISNAFSSILKRIPDAYLDLCVGQYVDSKYYLNFVSETGTTLDTCIVLDMEKIDPNGSPFWSYVTDMDNSHYIQSANKNIYSVHKDGWISRILVDGVYTHQRPERSDVAYSDDLVADGIRTIGIPWRFYLYFYRYSETLANLFDTIVHWKSGGFWSINMMVSAVIEGGTITDPKDGADLTKEISPLNTGNSFYDISHFDVDTYSGGSSFSYQNTDTKLIGNFFSYGFENLNRGEWATIYSIQPKLQLMKSSSMAQNI